MTMKEDENAEKKFVLVKSQRTAPEVLAVNASRIFCWGTCSHTVVLRIRIYFGGQLIQKRIVI